MGLFSGLYHGICGSSHPRVRIHMLEQYTLAGLSAGNAHRMMMLTSFTSIAPHNAGIPNAAAVLRMPYAECLKMYMLSTYIPGFLLLCLQPFYALKWGLSDR